MSNRGYLVDEIESIGEKICLASHIEEQLRGCEDENEKLELIQILNTTLYLRREQMSNLLRRGDNPNPMYHCAFKHALGGFMKDVEIYEATGKEGDLERCKNSADLLAMVCSKYLGMEFETCARCLADRILTKQVEREQSAKIEVNEKGDK